eukprot:5837687-Prymnesium_polylepis.1
MQKNQDFKVTATGDMHQYTSEKNATQPAIDREIDNLQTMFANSFVSEASSPQCSTRLVYHASPWESSWRSAAAAQLNATSS